MSMPNYPPPPGWPPPPQQPPPKNSISYGRAWAMAGIFFVGGLIFGAPIDTGGSSDTSSASASPRQTVSRAAPTTSVVPTSTAPAGPRTSFADGVWEVGVDVKPGKYKAPGTSGDSCYHAHLSGTTGSLDDIIGNHRGDGPQTVVIEEGQYFESDDCGAWTLQ